MAMRYNVYEDLKLIREMLKLSQEEMAFLIGVSKMTILRIENKTVYPNTNTMAKIYDFAYKKGIKINLIKEMFYREEHHTKKILFHGAKTEIVGDLSPFSGRSNNDFGKGFYCGESSEQAISFVARYPDSSLYMIEFDDTDMIGYSFEVNQEWMLAIAYYRGTLNKYKNHPLIKKIIEKVEKCDYIYAPIADNRMFMIIDQFIEGLITDEQCKHCLAATNLGKQYVFLNEKATSKLNVLERCFICSLEREESLKIKTNNVNDGDNKVKAALIKYKRKGKYIEEILDEIDR